MSGLSSSANGFELRFEPLAGVQSIYAFPCDAAGNVDLDALSERDRNRYFYARVALGRGFAICPRQQAQRTDSAIHVQHHLKEAA